MDLEDKITDELEWFFKPPALDTPLGLNDSQRELAREITDVCLDHIQSAVDWWISENTYLQQQLEDTEVDLWLTREDILKQEPKLNIKRRTVFK